MSSLIAAEFGTRSIFVVWSDSAGIEQTIRSFKNKFHGFKLRRVEAKVDASNGCGATGLEYCLCLFVSAARA